MSGGFNDYRNIIMNKTTTEICEELQVLPYAIIIAGKFLLCSIGTLGAAYQWWKHGVKWVVHMNSKVLFIFFYALIILLGAAYSGLYGFEFIRLQYPCFAHDFRIILWVRTTGLSAIVASHYIIMLISLERLFSSLYPKKYEMLSNHYLVALLVSTAIVVLTFFLIFFAVSDQFQLFSVEKYVATIDLKIAENSDACELTFTVLFWTFGASVPIFVADTYLNYFRNATKKKRSSFGDTALKINYQFSENRRVISALIPLEITNVAFTLFATLAQHVYNLADSQWSFISRAIYVECTALSPLYPLAFAFIIEWRVARRKKRTIVDITTEQARKDHFTELHRMWN